jgi:anti-sigma factor RsiW
MTNCDDLIPALVRAADGTLPADDRARLDAHLAACPACTEALADQRAMRQALIALAAEPVTTWVGTRVMATLRDERAGAASATFLDTLDWRRWTWRLVPVLAALALAVVNVARTNAAAETLQEAASVERPVSSALVTGEVGGDDLLSLLLSASPDAVLPETTTGGGQ